MIAFLKGKVVQTEEGRLYLDVNQIGFEIFMSSRDLERLKGGMDVTVFTYMHVKEDLMQLYGFLRREDLQMFKQVINVNGIGPKGALGIFSVLSANDLRIAIATNDSKRISKAPGIGAKTAQKLILEMKDKISAEDLLEKEEDSGVQKIYEADNGTADAIEALIALGYSPVEANKAVKKAAKEAGEGAKTERLLSLSLKYMI